MCKKQSKLIRIYVIKKFYFIFLVYASKVVLAKKHMKNMTLKLLMKGNIFGPAEEVCKSNQVTLTEQQFLTNVMQI